MRKVKQDELLALGAYESVRDRFRARMIEHKKLRRVLLGPEMSLVFEDHDTVLLQVQEMLRSERISAPAAIRQELDAYNDLVPPDDALLATLMIELNDRDIREQRRREYLGLDRHLWLEIGGQRVPARFAADGLMEDRVAVVHYVTFPMPRDARAALRDRSQQVRLVCTHPRYEHDVTLTDATRRALAEDLEPANADSAASAG
jgi:hypothetical protein